MKSSELTIDMRVVKDLGANSAIVLAVINNADGKMTISEVAGAVGITYPTAHKCLDLLFSEKYIQAVDKSTYRKF